MTSVLTANQVLIWSMCMRCCLLVLLANIYVLYVATKHALTLSIPIHYRTSSMVSSNKLVLDVTWIKERPKNL